MKFHVFFHRNKKLNLPFTKIQYKINLSNNEEKT